MSHINKNIEQNETASAELLADSQISSNSRIAKNALMLYIRMFISMVVGLYTSRVVLNTLGVEDYGIYGVVGSVVAMLGFLNSSMAGATSRFITFELGKGNLQRLKDTFSSSMIIHIGIAIVVFIVAETVGLWFLNDKLVIPPHRMYAAQWVYQLSILSAMLTITQVPYNACIIAHERMSVYAYIEILNVTLKLIIVYLLVIGNSDKLILYASLTLVVSIIVMMTYRIYCIRKFQECHFRWKWNKEILRPLLSFSGWDLYGNMCFTVRQQGSNFILNIFCGVIINAATSIATTIQNTLLTFSSNIITAFKPSIIKSYSIENYKHMNYLIGFATKISAFVLTLISVPILIQTEFIINLWLGNVPFGVVDISKLCVIANFCSVFGSILIIAIHATGKIKNMTFTCGSIYLISLPIQYVLLYIGYDYNSSFVLYNIIILIFLGVNIYIFNKQLPQFNVKNYLFKILFPVIIVTAFIYYLCNNIYSCDSQITEFSIKALITLFSTAILYFLFVFNKDERKSVISFIRKENH